MLRNIGVRIFLWFATRTSNQTFNEKKVVPDNVVGHLRKKWKVGTRGVFVRAYVTHHDRLTLTQKSTWKRIAQDYAQYCTSWHRWLPYYVLRAYDST